MLIRVEALLNDILIQQFHQIFSILFFYYFGDEIFESIEDTKKDPVNASQENKRTFARKRAAFAGAPDVRKIF